MPNNRRLLLRVAVKLMLGLSLLALLWLFINAREPAEPEPAKAFPLPALAPGELYKLEWRGRRILVLAYDPALLEVLKGRRLHAALADPDDQLPRRLAYPGLLVALDYGGELGCPLEWRGTEASDTTQPWYGGLEDSCRGSRYDPLGRIYAEANWGMNLAQPQHRFEGNTLLLGGE